MIPPQFEYYSPRTLPEALSLLETSGENAKILAGGQSLIPIMKLRLGAPSTLIDINKIEKLSFVAESDGFLKIGALTRMADVESSSLIKSKYPVIYDASVNIADPLVRNLGTFGGNVSHADPANDLPAVMLALKASFVAAGPGGRTRVVDWRDFFVDTFTTSLGHNEILTEIHVPQSTAGNGGAYLKLEKRVGDYAIVGVAVQVNVDMDGKVSKAGIGLTAVGPTAIVAEEAENALKGAKLTDEAALNRAGDLASKASNPTTDLRGPAEYKTKMVKVMTVRALKKAGQRATMNRGGM
jgi:aerobic carbon-monoxide dehydrogenase medium subunit